MADEARRYALVVGLECHAELLTASKMFSSCPVVDSVEAEPNCAVDPLSLGMPGTLPVVNRRAIEYALRVAVALNCRIHAHNVFARKNYFYPDLPKGYQISQYESPLATAGWLSIEAEPGVRKRIGIRRVHMEEDTGKNTHLDDGSSLVDFNRAGIPLLEIVSEPDLATPEEVADFGSKLRQLLRYLGVNSGDMERGVLRLEPNISVRPEGSDELGTRTEVKNLNSFKALSGATAYEFDRQVRILESGGSVVQETRGWDENLRRTFSQRVKEEANDYRYLPEPDLPALFIDDAWIATVRANLPELPDARRARYQTAFGLSRYDASVLTDERTVADWFEAVVSNGADAKATANWMLNNLFGLMNEHQQSIESIRISPASLAELLALVDDGSISNNAAKQVLAEMFKSGRSPAHIVDEAGLLQMSDKAALRAIILEVLEDNADQVEAYRQGKSRLRGWFVGRVMQATRGKANPKMVNELLDLELDNSSE